jgi:hypothetical protein
VTASVRPFTHRARRALRDQHAQAFTRTQTCATSRSSRSSTAHARAQSYTASATAITAVGAQEEYQLGQALRALYINASSPADVAGLNHDLFVQSQVFIQADAGGEGGVIFDSTVALTQVRPHSPRNGRSLTPAAGPVAEHEPVHLFACERDQCDLAARGLSGKCSAMPCLRQGVDADISYSTFLVCHGYILS